MKQFNIKINGKTCKAKTGQNILKVAEDNGIEIPAFCYHCDFPPKANCRVCVVEVKGQKKLQTSFFLSEKRLITNLYLSA